MTQDDVILSREVHDAFNKLSVRPVLLDIGAARESPPIWEQIARHSVYVGFDPDRREIAEIPDGKFLQAVIINKAVTAEEKVSQVFYLTVKPQCSSTLSPDHESLSEYFFADLFQVERQVTVDATSLDAVVDQLSLEGIDWFKTDSQGTDLRLFMSLRPELRSRVLAVDVEPGLMDAYCGEDLFVDAHREIVQNGFWFSSVRIGAVLRMRRDNMGRVAAIDPEMGEEQIKATGMYQGAPGWCVARYLRTMKSLVGGKHDKRNYFLLWVFSLLDRKFGFAFDVGVKYEQTFGKDEISDLMQRESVRMMKEVYENRQSPSVSLAGRAEGFLRALFRRGR